jgi:anti-anti-sigma factor
MLVEVAPGYAHRNFPLGPELIRAIHAWIDPLLAGWAIDEDSARELQLVAEEIASNVAQYAGLEAGDSLELELVYRGAELALEVRDGGFAFNPLENAGRSALGRGSDSAEIGGLGVHLLTLLTDRQEYRRDGNYNVLRVVKDLSAPTCKPGANREAHQAHEAEHMDLTTTVSVDEENSVARVALAGALNTDTAPGFELRLQDVVDAGHQLTVLDMQDLNYISSAGLRVIFKAAKQTRGEGRKLAAANRKPHIDKVFEILKALPDMAVFANEQELDDYLEAMQAQARGV